MVPLKIILVLTVVACASTMTYSYAIEEELEFGITGIDVGRHNKFNRRITTVRPKFNIDDDDDDEVHDVDEELPIDNKNIDHECKRRISKRKRYPYLHWQRPSARGDSEQFQYYTNDADLISQYRPRNVRHAQDPNNNNAFQGNLNAVHQRHYGTDVTAEARGRLWQSQDRLSQVDGTAQYQRHFGGQSGTGRPNYGVGVQYTRKF